VDIIAAGRQIGRIWVPFVYPSNQRLHIRLSLGMESQESFVDSLTDYVGQPDPALAKPLRLAETLGIEHPNHRAYPMATARAVSNQ
jgi:hypothetical protein